MYKATGSGGYSINEMNVERITEVARALSDGTRLRLLSMLLKGPKTVSELAAGLGMVQPGISAHLGVLKEAELVVYEVVGRQHVYRVRRDRVQELLGALTVLSGGGAPGAGLGDRTAREALLGSPVCAARSCYDHLAGLAGVELLEGMLQLGWLEANEDGERVTYRLTQEGKVALEKKGVDVGAARRARRLFAFGCRDWTELDLHLGGSLGAEIFGTLQDADFLLWRKEERAVAVLRPLDQWLC